MSSTHWNLRPWCSYNCTFSTLLNRISWVSFSGYRSSKDNFNCFIVLALQTLPNGLVPSLLIFFSEFLLYLVELLSTFTSLDQLHYHYIVIITNTATNTTTIFIIIIITSPPLTLSSSPTPLSPAHLTVSPSKKTQSALFWKASVYPIYCTCLVENYLEDNIVC